ncbi:MAG TPA: ribose 5-phosphate isomerase B [Rickettsiales bacterium]|nr:ribose 5-phosphate isomerase B [Rickettsiales bacterium]
MNKRIIAIGNDHGGTELKNKITNKFKNDFEFIDCGTDNTDSVDYPDYSKKVCELVLSKKVEFGILICGTGIGMSISANRYKGIRAALCFHSQMARLAKEHNNANILCLGARMIGDEVAFECFYIFSKTTFAGGRHLKRIEKIDNN